MDKVRKILRVVMLALAVVIAVLFVWRGRLAKQSADQQASMQKPDFGTVPDFSLTERSGRTVTRADLKGRVWVAAFVFTRCAGPCPIISNEMAGLSNAYAAKPNVRFVTFTVDPEYDTPPVLSAYADRYKADRERWLFLTGPKDAMFKLIQQGFKLAVEKLPGKTPPHEGHEGHEMPELPPDITHSIYLVLVDGEGRIVGYYNSTSPDSIALLKKEIDQRA